MLASRPVLSTTKLRENKSVCRQLCGFLSLTTCELWAVFQDFPIALL